jgi:hypothetical protein
MRAPGKGMIRQTVLHGAKAGRAGSRVPKQGSFVQPTILTEVVNHKLIDAVANDAHC